MESLITFDGVSKDYSTSNNNSLAIKDISFQVYKNEILSILGPSGCGKTTILRLIANSIIPSKGRIDYGSKPIEWAKKNSLIGLVSQSPSLLPNRTVKENIALSLEIRGGYSEEKIHKIIELMGLVGSENYYPYQLSGGMKQRTSLARSMIYDPELLLMDEPFASLDEIIRERLNSELINIQRKTQQTIIFVTHNIEEAVFLSDRILILSNTPGNIIGKVNVGLPKNRTSEVRSTQEFFDITKQVRLLLKESYV